MMGSFLDRAKPDAPRIHAMRVCLRRVLMINLLGGKNKGGLVNWSLTIWNIPLAWA